MTTICIATLNDIATIQQIAKTTWASAYAAIISTEQIEYMLDKMYSTSSLTQQISNGHVFYLAKVNNAVVGFASVSKEDDLVFKLNKLYILPTTQKTGAGKLLLNTVIHYAKQQNGTQLQLQVNRANNAKDFYLKNGFVIDREEDFAIGNNFFMNDYVMSLSL